MGIKWSFSVYFLHISNDLTRVFPIRSHMCDFPTGLKVLVRLFLFRTDDLLWCGGP